MRIVEAVKLKSFSKLSRSSYIGDNLSALSEIFKEKINISIWQRKLDSNIRKEAEDIINLNPDLQLSTVIYPKDIKNFLLSNVKSENISLIYQDITKLADVFCNFFNCEKVSLRFGTLDHAMCPRFHVDMVQCRLITTYHGVATEWLQHSKVDRTKLGLGNKGRPDEESGIYQKSDDIEQLEEGHVALLKGESWSGNEGAGLVHRSPKVESVNQIRLLLTIDFSDK